MWTGPAPNLFEQACKSHDFFHQSAKVLAHQFNLSFSDVQGIVQSCPACQKSGLGLRLGVNPRGLLALQLWQMDVTHVSEFGRQKYVHVSVDTFSLAVWATAQTGESAKHVIHHLLPGFCSPGSAFSHQDRQWSCVYFSQFCSFLCLMGYTPLYRTSSFPHGTSYH